MESFHSDGDPLRYIGWPHLSFNQVRPTSKIKMKPENKPQLCPVCTSQQTQFFFYLQDMPVHIGILWPDKTSAQNAPVGDITLNVCQKCGHIFNSSFNEESMNYDLPYDNSLFFSGIFRQFAEDLSTQLINKYTLNYKNIVEIGSGLGDFLKLICEQGNNKGWGFDPSYQPDFSLDPFANQLTFIKGYYQKKLINEKIDFLFSRHTLEHLPNPRELIQQLKEDFDQENDVVFYFEVPNADFMLRETKIWDLIYEHCQYFTASSLRYLFEDNGFEVLDLYETFDNQYLSIECRISGENTINIAKNFNYGDQITQFSENATKMIVDWRNHFSVMLKNNSKSVIWGAGAKGVCFLNILKMPASNIVGAVDINPRKQKKFVPVAGQQIFLPEELKVIQPDQIIVMNSIYLDEIKIITQRYGLPDEICISL